MSVFQSCAVLGLAAALVWEVVCVFRRPVRFGMWIVRMLTYSAMAMMIAFPDLVQEIAAIVGIHRGSDLVMYAFELLIIFLAFFFYSRIRHLELHVTRLIRRDAIEHARRGDSQMQPDEPVSVATVPPDQRDATALRGAGSPLRMVIRKTAAGTSDGRSTAPNRAPRHDAASDEGGLLERAQT